VWVQVDTVSAVTQQFRVLARVRKMGELGVQHKGHQGARRKSWICLVLYCGEVFSR
jgi:hypothetical protein